MNESLFESFLISPLLLNISKCDLQS